MTRGVLIYNPAAGGRTTPEHMRGVVERARATGVELEPRPTTAPGSAPAIVAQALRRAPDLIVAAGGDGTVGEVAGALVDSRVPLAILPYGTANVLAREFGIGVDVMQAERCLASDVRRSLTAWHAAGRIATMWMGVGFDARMLRSVHPTLKRNLGRVGIAFTALAEFWQYEFPTLRIEGVGEDGSAFEHEATYAVAANIQRYGGDMMLAPGADPADKLLDLVLFTGRDRASLTRLLLRIAAGGMRDPIIPDVIRLRARSMMARSTVAAGADVQVDGDYVGTTPATIGPVAGVVEVMVPGGVGR